MGFLSLDRTEPRPVGADAIARLSPPRLEQWLFLITSYFMLAFADDFCTLPLGTVQKGSDKMANNAKAVGYIRVSTEGQAVDGVSLDAQREKINAYCSLHSLELLETIADEGLSGKRADNRPGLQRALEMACKHKAVLVVYSLSRLARSTRDCIEIADRIERCGADLASISEKLDTTSSMGRFFFRLMASLGELERDQISERTTAALAHMRRQNRRIGRVPFGFDLAADGETLIPNADEMRTIRDMQSRREQGESYHAIADALNAAGVNPKAGEKWHASSVRMVLLTEAKRTPIAA